MGKETMMTMIAGPGERHKRDLCEINDDVSIITTLFSKAKNEFDRTKPNQTKPKEIEREMLIGGRALVASWR